MKSSLEIVHLNIRSIIKFFDSFVTWLSTCDDIPDFVTLSKIWVEQHESNPYKLQNYVAFRAGGIAVFVRNYLISFKAAEV